MCFSLCTALRRVLISSKWTACAQYSTRSSTQSRIYKFTSNLRDYLSRGPDENKVDAFVHRRLDVYRRSPHASYKVFEPTISLLINQKCFLAATSVYDRMLKSGVIPSLSLNAKVLAMATAMSPEDVTFLAALETMFCSPHFTESTLEEALRVMVVLGTPRTVIMNVIKNFIETKSEDYTPGKFLLSKLVDAQVRENRLEDALDTLAEYEEAISDASDSTSVQGPYVAIMSAIRDTRSWDSAAVNRVLEIMQANNIQPSTSIFNILIAREVRQSQLYNAFSIYTMLKVMADNVPTTAPDAYTFGSLFNALCRMYKPKARAKTVQKSGGDGDESNIILSPRRLFFDMMQTYHDQPWLLMASAKARPPKAGLAPLWSSTFPVSGAFEPTPNLLNLAIRCFIRSRDYAAAIVAISAFLQLKQAITPMSYSIVLKHILSRIRGDIKRHRIRGESRWGDVFLGVYPHVMIWQMKVGGKLMRRVLEYAKRSNFDVRQGVLEGASWAEILGKYVPPPLTLPKRFQDSFKEHKGEETGTFVTPTFEMLEGEEPIPANMRPSVIPLVRLLRRALWADVMQRELALKNIPSSRAWSRAVRQAKSEMVPR
ncbi:hypothetical protein AX14_005351 [Amanita brunnescens Koide BX004]|nr:hypothetical protein AX14_005351 [Amanita brunnescens Koide BX004]